MARSADGRCRSSSVPISQRIRSAAAPMGRRADLRLARTVPQARQRLRSHPGERRGLGSGRSHQAAHKTYRTNLKSWTPFRIKLLKQQEQLSQSYKLKAQKKELNFSRSLTLIVQDVLSSPGVFYLVSFITSTGSHVIAVSSGDCKAVLIFDPNFGEFKLQKSRLEDFLSALLKEGYKAEPKAINGLSQWTFNA